MTGPRGFCHIAFLSALLLAAAATMSVSSAAGTDESVRARGWVHRDEGFARLVFDWATPVGYSARIEGKKLIVEFDRPASYALDRALRLLSPYVAGIAEQSERRLVFDLTQPWRLKSFVDGTHVAIDLLGAPKAPTAMSVQPARSTTSAASIAAAPAAPTVPPAGSVSPAAAPFVALRVGEHDGFTRLVFDWPAPSPYRIERQGDEARILFDAPARLGLDAAVKRLPPPIRDLRAEGSEGKPALVVELAPGTRIKDFQDGPRLVLDLSGAVAPSTAAAVPDGASGAPMPDLADPASIALAAAPGASAAQPAATTSSPANMPPPSPAPATSTGSGDGAADSAGKPLNVLPANAMTAADLLAGASAAQPAGAGTRPARVTAPGIPAGDPNAPSLAVGIEQGAEGPSLKFPWAEPTGLAAFRRAGALWLVFDRPARFDLSALAGLDPASLGSVSVVPGAVAALRLTDLGDLAALPRRDGNGWVVDFQPRAEGPKDDIPVTPDLAASPPRLLLQTVTAGDALPVTDPEVGDTLLVVGMAEPGKGVAEAKAWPAFRLLPTIQGIAVEPRQDGVQVARTADGIAVLAGIDADPAAAPPRAEVPVAEGANAQESAPAATDRLFDLPAWRRENEGDFAKVEARLQAAIQNAPEEARELPRIDLARFYFAHGRAAEAGGLVDLIAASRNEPLLDPELLLIRGAAAFLTNDPVAADRALGQPALDGEIEAEPWRGAVAALKGDWETAAALFRDSAPLVADYPQAARFRLAALAAEAAIETLDPVGADDWIERLKADKPTPAQTAQIAFLEGLSARRQGRVEEARTAWGTVGPEADPDTVQRTEFARVDLDLETHQIADADAIKRLEALRFGARGSLLEFPLLRRLGDLYLAGGKPREGLTLLRQLATAYPRHRDVGAAMAEMTNGFRDAFLGPNAKSLTPLEAVALYDEFRELTPAGAEGSKVALAVADRMIEVDLLGRAAELLEDQVRHRLTGADKAEAGARLAAIRLLDDHPEKALAALAESSVPDPTPPLAAERRRLEAEALHRAGRSLEALTLLASDSDLEAGKLKARIFWELREWGQAADAFDGLLASADPQKLTPEEAQWVLGDAIALALGGDPFALAGLKQRFGAAMKETAQAEPFALLTDPESDGNTLLAQKLASVARFESFLSDYRAKLQAGAAAADLIGTDPAPADAPVQIAAPGAGG
ncbi:MAG: hypothetical protein ACOY3L_03290 [Pseudomonadota bacterium]